MRFGNAMQTQGCRSHCTSAKRMTSILRDVVNCNIHSGVARFVAPVCKASVKGPQQKFNLKQIDFWLPGAPLTAGALVHYATCTIHCHVTDNWPTNIRSLRLNCPQ